MFNLNNNFNRLGIFDDRYLVTIYRGLENINRRMVEDGYAWSYLDDGKYKIYQDIASSRSLNIWSDNNPIPPETFRKMQKKEYYVKLADHRISDCRTNRFKKCSDFDTCIEALYWFDICGHKYLDGNHNNIPCETLCK